ncbi:phage baseplate protein [Methylobacterium sp. SI9]|uniref:phage baseplate protein n=1 Tax=Methylobacterium guangdongense TaxID=3138811 RepID=UPI00313B82E6
MAGGVLFRGGPFRIGLFVPDVTVEAVGQDALGITGAPVETGATVTDHSFKLPVRLEMLPGWSDSSAGYDGYIQEIYRKLLALQATRQPFSMSTSRRLYRNMLLESITDPINANTFSAMLPRLTFRELIITRTQTSSESTAKPASNPANQANPQSTGSVVDRGTVQTQDVGPQAFAGAYNPGSQSPVGPGAYQVDGSAASGTLGLGGINPPTAMPIDYGQISGLSPPATINLPEISVSAAPDPISGLQAAGPDQYNIFGGGP